VKKYGRAREATCDGIIWCIRIVCWITKATDTHSECVILLGFHDNIGHADASLCYVIRNCLSFVCCCERKYSLIFIRSDTSSPSYDGGQADEGDTTTQHKLRTTFGSWRLYQN
jgi:hypothetical protein